MDVMQLLLLLGLDVLVLLHPAGVLQVAPVGGQSHQEVDLGEGEDERGLTKSTDRPRCNPGAGEGLKITSTSLSFPVTVF